jgi:hypothetical protein
MVLINLEVYQNQIKGNLQEKQHSMGATKTNYPMDNDYQIKSPPVVALWFEINFLV